jgi:hypothetical protein
MRSHDEFTEDEWTPEERAQLVSLPTERIPPSELKGKTMDAVRRNGFVGRQRIVTPRRVLALVAAASLIFIAGALVGYAAARRTARPADDGRVANREAVANAENSKTNSQQTRHVVWY